VTEGTFAATKLQVYFDDQIVSTQVIEGSGTYPVSYSPTETGSHTFKAVVTDMGLYQGTDSQTVNVTNVSGGGGAFQGQSPSDGSKVNQGTVTFKWTGDDGANTYRLYVDGSPQGTTNSTQITGVVLGAVGSTHSWYVKADNGDQTDPISFKLK
jgi:hypothetical protein